MEPNIVSGAFLSEDGKYRYSLWRTWDDNLPSVTWIMLNPSTADALNNDPTIRKCMSFAKSWGYGGIHVVNIFAYRATDPKELAKLDYFEACGPEANDYVFRPGADMRIAAWGVHGKLHDRGALVRDMYRETGVPLHVLKLTKDGHPSHPLFLKGDLKPVLWTP